jgi:uncharacterized cupin superfamily protein
MDDPQSPRTEDGFCAPFNADDVEWREHNEAPGFGVRWKPLGHFGGSVNVGVEICELAPGKQAWPAHYHMAEEEQIWMLEGAATLRLGERSHVMSAGDYVVFPAGQKAGHAMINHTDQVCRYLVIGENKTNEVVVYTRSNKVGVRVLGERYDKGAVMDYWQGEAE